MRANPVRTLPLDARHRHGRRVARRRALAGRRRRSVRAPPDRTERSAGRLLMSAGHERHDRRRHDPARPLPAVHHRRRPRRGAGGAGRPCRADRAGHRHVRDEARRGHTRRHGRRRLRRAGSGRHARRCCTAAFPPLDELSSDAAVAVVSNALARELAGSDALPAVVGRDLQLRDKPRRVVGVLDSFAGERGFRVLRAARIVAGGHGVRGGAAGTRRSPRRPRASRTSRAREAPSRRGPTARTRAGAPIAW